jgi:DNA-binding MarR family transcriptional regulator
MSADRRDVASRLHSAAIHMLRAARVADTRSGLSPARLSALSVLVFGGPRTIGALAGAEGVRSPTMTQLVNGLESDGLVRRRSAAAGPTGGGGDRRQVTVEATPAGEAAMRTAQGRRLDVLLDLLEDAGAADVELLDRAAALIEQLVRSHAEREAGSESRRQAGVSTRPATTPG